MIPSVTSPQFRWHVDARTRRLCHRRGNTKDLPFLSTRQTESLPPDSRKPKLAKLNPVNILIVILNARKGFAFLFRKARTKRRPPHVNGRRPTLAATRTALHETSSFFPEKNLTRFGLSKKAVTDLTQFPSHSSSIQTAQPAKSSVLRLTADETFPSSSQIVMSFKIEPWISLNLSRCMRGTPTDGCDRPSILLLFIVDKQRAVACRHLSGEVVC